MTKAILLPLLCLAIILICFYILQTGDIIQKVFSISACKAKTESAVQAQLTNQDIIYSTLEFSEMETQALATGFAISRDIVYIPMDSLRLSSAHLISNIQR